MMKYILLCLVIALLASCGGDSEKTKKLAKKYEQIKQEKKILEEQNRKLSTRLQRDWQRSLKYRFPEIKKMLQNVKLSIKELFYIKQVHFIYRNGNVVAEFSYYTQKQGIKPYFEILLFNADGLNIARTEVKYLNIFRMKKVLPPGKIIKHKYTINYIIKRNPIYFLIRKIEE